MMNVAASVPGFVDGAMLQLLLPLPPRAKDAFVHTQSNGALDGSEYRR